MVLSNHLFQLKYPPTIIEQLVPGFVDVSPNAILWYNYQLMTKSKHSMNFTIFGVNSPQFSMDLPTANIINTPSPAALVLTTLFIIAG